MKYNMKVCQVFTNERFFKNSIQLKSIINNYLNCDE